MNHFVFQYLGPFGRSASLIRGLITAFLLMGTQWAWAQATLSITPLTWNVIGLDSNNTTVGPDTFPVGARVCNTGPSAATGLSASFAFTGGTAAGLTAINLSGASSISYGTLGTGSAPPSQYTINTAPANCADFYYNAQITRSSASYNQTRSFQITATASNAANVSTPVNRELYVEKLLSQARNSITSITGDTAVFVGNTYRYIYTSSTAPGGYEQLQNFINWPNAVFQVLSVSTTYAQPTGGINSAAYGDACGFQNDPTTANYRSCVGPTNYSGGKVGGSPIQTEYTIKILSAATTSIAGVVQDFSGSSYHYNSDYGTVPITITSRNRQSDLGITKTNNQTSVSPNSTTSYSIVVTNSGPDPAVSTTVGDLARTGLTKTSVTCAASAGTACPATVSVAALEGTGLLILSSAVNSTLTLTVVATVTASSGTVTNVATVSPNINVTADPVKDQVNLTISKTNNTTTVAAGSTTSYTVTVSNLGPSTANNAVVMDAPSNGLSCTSVQCTVLTGGASCPTALTQNTVVSAGATNYFGTGEAIPTLPPNSSVTFRVICGYTATGQ